MNGTLVRAVAILGATGNIGTEVGRELLRLGYQVGLIARDRTRLVDTRNELDPSGERTCFSTADVTDEAQLHDCLQHVKTTIGRLDAIVYSIGLEPDVDVPLALYPLESWSRTFATYTTGFFLCFREACSILPSGGHVLAVSSAVTRFQQEALPHLYLGHYAASKAALNEFCKWARREAHERGILLSRIAPSAVDTQFHRTAPVGRRPSAVVPLAFLAQKIAATVIAPDEVDEDVIAPFPTAVHP